MDLKTLRQKSREGLTQELENAQAHLKELLFKRSSNQLKNVREIRQVKKLIARIQTLLTQSTV